MTIGAKTMTKVRTAPRERELLKFEPRFTFLFLPFHFFLNLLIQPILELITLLVYLPHFTFPIWFQYDTFLQEQEENVEMGMSQCSSKTVVNLLMISTRLGVYMFSFECFPVQCMLYMPMCLCECWTLVCFKKRVWMQINRPGNYSAIFQVGDGEDKATVFSKCKMSLSKQVYFQAFAL